MHLQAIHDSRNSFYGKAVLKETVNYVDLISYTTKVASLNKVDGSITITGYYSPTTARHINEFLLQNRFNKLSKKQMELKPTLHK